MQMLLLFSLIFSKVRNIYLFRITMKSYQIMCQKADKYHTYPKIHRNNITFFLVNCLKNSTFPCIFPYIIQLTSLLERKLRHMEF